MQTMWRKIRIIILLLILATTLQQVWLDNNDLAWKRNFYVAIYPVNADGTANVSAYLRTLQPEDFEPVAEYFAEAATPYALGLRRPIELRLGAQVDEVPPAPPVDSGVLSTVIWSLKFRLFAWANSPKVNVKPDIRLYLLYHDPAAHNGLSHSTALSKGRIGRVNLYADHAHHAQNLVILAHELLHTLRATDKYDLRTTLPDYPTGYAEPDRNPLYPQHFAELMGGRIPQSEHRAEIPKNLGQTLIGEVTAREIGWLK